jgi:hypothetical protein
MEREEIQYDPHEWISEAKRIASKAAVSESEEPGYETEHFLDAQGREIFRVCYMNNHQLRSVVRYRYSGNSQKYCELTGIDASGRVEIHHKTGERPFVRPL